MVAGLRLLGVFFPLVGLGWGELGHQVLGRLAADLAAAHPALSGKNTESFSDLLVKRRLQQAHLGNIPDIHWRNLEGKMEPLGRKLGDPTHFFDSEYLLGDQTFETFTIPLRFDAARALFDQKNPGRDFFKDAGTLPWRAQQFMDLYQWALSRYPKKLCAAMTDTEKEATREVLTYAGLLSHFTSDVTQPHHTSVDYDGQQTGQQGIHAYFETTLVDAMRSDIDEKVERRARVLLTSAIDPRSTAMLWKKVKDKYPKYETEGPVVALMFILIADGLAEVETLRNLDLKYAVASLGEAKGIKGCERYAALAPTRGKDSKALSNLFAHEGRRLPDACRRLPSAEVEGKKVHQWFEPLVVERLALAVAVTSDLWVRGYLKANAPELCWTWRYALKPRFISPDDPGCLGYYQTDYSMKKAKKAPGVCRVF